MKKSTISYILLLNVIIIMYDNRLMHTFLHYGISTYQSYFTNQWIKVSYSKVKIPKNWYIISQNNDQAFLAGPPFRITGKRIYMKIYKNIESIKKNFFYMDEKFCSNVDDEIQIKNITSYIDNGSHKLIFPGNILFCKNLENSYVVFNNYGLMTLIVIKPYQQEFKEQYVKLFKNLKFQTNKLDLPNWLVQDYIPVENSHINQRQGVNTKNH